MPPIPKSPPILLPSSCSFSDDEDENSSNSCNDEESLLLLRNFPKYHRYDSDLVNDQDDHNENDACTKNQTISFSLSAASEEDEKVTSYSKIRRRIQSFLRRLWSNYYEGLEKRPLLVKSITAFVLMGLADCFAQIVERIKEDGIGTTSTTVTTGLHNMDWLRTLRFAIFGLVGAPWTHYYYYWLDTVLPPTIEPWTWTTASTYRIS